MTAQERFNETFENMYELQQYKRLAVSYMNKFLATPEEEVNKEFTMEVIHNSINKLIDQWLQYQNMLIPMLRWQVGSTPLAIHSYNVGSISFLLGNALGMSRDDLYMLTLSAIGHDIGKNYISPFILDKNGPLAITEKTAMQQHPRLGAIYVKNHYPETDKIVIDTILAHHEIEDGSGYYGFKGDDIPLFAKILRTADIFCALTEDRSYHMSKNCKQSLAKLKKFPYINEDYLKILEKNTVNIKESNSSNAYIEAILR